MTDRQLALKLLLEEYKSGRINIEQCIEEIEQIYRYEQT